MRRVVAEYTSGPLAGLRQIHGLISGVEFAPQIDGIRLNTHVVTMRLVAVRERYILYREWVLDGLESEDREVRSAE